MSSLFSHDAVMDLSDISRISVIWNHHFARMLKNHLHISEIAIIFQYWEHIPANLRNLHKEGKVSSNGKGLLEISFSSCWSFKKSIKEDRRSKVILIKRWSWKCWENENHFFVNVRRTIIYQQKWVQKEPAKFLQQQYHQEVVCHMLS